MPKPVCVACGLFFKPKRCGVAWEESMPQGRAEDGPDARWVPYKLWMADLYECRGCRTQIIVGHGRDPIAEHYQPGYRDARAAHLPLVIVNDC